MSVSLIVWLSVAGILLLILVIRIVSEYKASRQGDSRNHRRHHFRLVELGRETDEFYIPGDVTGTSRYDDYDQYYN